MQQESFVSRKWNTSYGQGPQELGGYSFHSLDHGKEPTTFPS